MKIWKAYSQLTKTGIILFAVVSAMAGFAVSFHLHQDFDPLQPVLLVMASTYVGSGILIRVAGVVRRFRPARPPAPEHQIG